MSTDVEPPLPKRKFLIFPIFYIYLTVVACVISLLRETCWTLLI